jgi:hypothetical protein
MACFLEVLKSLDWNSLLSGLVGAIIGAGISGVATFLTSRSEVKKSISLQVAWDRERLEQQDSQRRRSLVRSLLGELLQNIEAAKAPSDHYSWVTLSSESWSLARGEVYFLPTEVQEMLRKAYVAVHRYATKLVDRRVVNDVGRGTWDGTMMQDVSAFREVALLVVPRLQQWLEESKF